MSFDGLGADALARQQGLPAFERLGRDGASARVIPVNPTQTLPAHAAILTGADPQKSGIVANRFHLSGTPADQETRAMSVDADVETLIEAARRQGKQVGSVPWPSIDNRTPRRSADFGLTWSEPVVRSRVITLTRGDFKREWVPPGWTPRPQRRPSYSPIMRARLEWAVPGQTRLDVDLVAYDRTDDSVENYDAIFLESGDFEAAPDHEGWIPISKRADGVLFGSWSKILRVDPALREVAVYWGPINRNEAWPTSFRTVIEEEAGFWPGTPDERLDARTFSEQVARLSDFVTRAQTLAMQKMQFDLLLAYNAAIDEASHPYITRDPSVVRDAFVAADRALAELTAAADPQRDAIIVTGDHGLVPQEREIRVNRLLADAGLTTWRAFASGHIAHIYGAGDADAVVNVLTNSGYFERVEKKTAASHRNSGDIVAFAYPTNTLSSSSEAPLVANRTGRGQHGALNTHRELHTVLFAFGAGVPKGPLGEIAQTSIAAFVKSLLAIQ